MFQKLIILNNNIKTLKFQKELQKWGIQFKNQKLVQNKK